MSENAQSNDLPTPAQLAEVYRAAIVDNDRETANLIRDAALKMAKADSSGAEARTMSQFALRIQP